jgi:hypothetical protein
MKFKVTVQRVEIREHVFEVDEESKMAAEWKALEDAGNFDFKDATFCDESYKATNTVKE